MGQSPPLLIQGVIGGKVQYLHLTVRILLIPQSALPSNQWNCESASLRYALRRAFGWARAEAGNEI
jgi:hypothetical protein